MAPPCTGHPPALVTAESSGLGLGLWGLSRGAGPASLDPGFPGGPWMSGWAVEVHGSHPVQCLLPCRSTSRGWARWSVLLWAQMGAQVRKPSGRAAGDSPSRPLPAAWPQSSAEKAQSSLLPAPADRVLLPFLPQG